MASQNGFHWILDTMESTQAPLRLPYSGVQKRSNWPQLGGSGIKKKGGGNDASMHSGMFDSARVRGVKTLRMHWAVNQTAGNSFLLVEVYLLAPKKKKLDWDSESSVSELGGQRDGQQRTGVLLSLLFRVWRWLSFFCYWIGWPPAS